MPGFIAFLLLLLASFFGCGYVATTPINTTGKEEITIDEPRYRSEVFAGPWQIEIPFVWGSESGATELYAAIVDPSTEPPTIFLSRKVDHRDKLTLYNAGLYRTLRDKGWVKLEVVIYAFKPAQFVVQAPDPVARALEFAMSKPTEGKYFEIINGEVEIEARLPITVIVGPPSISDDVWVDPGVKPRLWVTVESVSSQISMQGAWLQDKWVAQGSSGYVRTERFGNGYRATFEAPVPPNLKSGDRFVSAFRARDAVGQSVDRIMGWNVVGSKGDLQLTQLPFADTERIVNELHLSWRAQAVPMMNPPLKAVNTGTKAVNPNPVYDWIDSVITGSGGNK